MLAVQATKKEVRARRPSQVTGEHDRAERETQVADALQTDLRLADSLMM